MKKRFFLTILLICCINVILISKEDPPLPAFIYNSRPVGAKAIAMGEAFVAVSDDASAAYWNPAGLKQLKKKYLTICMNPSRKTDASDEELFANDSLEGKRLIFLGFAGPKSAFAFIPLANYSGLAQNKTIEIRANKYAFSSSTQYTPKMLFGITVNYISAQLGVIDPLTNQANIADGNGVSVDFGLLYTASNIMKMGFSIQNSPGYIWWNDYNRQQLKTHLRAGISSKPLQAKWLLISADYENINSIKKEFYHAGLQQTITQHLFFRQGIASEKLFRKSDKKYYTTGVGYEIKNWLIDFATKRYKLDNPDKDNVTDYTFSLSMPF